MAKSKRIGSAATEARSWLLKKTFKICQNDNMLLTIDIGTSTFKSAIWDYNGNRLSFHSVPLLVKTEGDKHEADPAQWINAYEENCTKHERFKNIELIVISGNGPSLVTVTEDVKHETARLWMDRRAVKYQEEVSELMGGFVDSKFFLPKILYIKNEENEIYKKTKYFVGCPEYLAYTLTGQAKSVFPCDGFNRWFWNDTVLEKLGLDTQKFPPFIKPGELFGYTKNNIPVISGGPDFFAAILGSGVNKPGQACDRTGTSEGINLCTKNYVNTDKLKSSGLMCYGHPVKPYWNLSGIINSSGKAIEEECSKLNISIKDFFELAQKDKNAKSVLEKIGFEMRDIIISMEKSGEKVEYLYVTGGLSEIDILNQIKADITGKEVFVVSHKEAELLGLFIIGACYRGIYNSYEEASLKMCKVIKSYEPNQKLDYSSRV